MDFIGQFAYDCYGSQNVCPEGFTIFLWMTVQSYSSAHNYVVFRAMNQNTGMMIDFRPIEFTKTNSFWLTIRDGTTTERLYLFKLEPDVWSHLGITWYNSGENHFRINGVIFNNSYTRSTSLAGNLDRVAQLQFWETLSDTNNQTAVGGGMDELMIMRAPLTLTDLLKIYG